MPIIPRQLSAVNVVAPNEFYTLSEKRPMNPLNDSQSVHGSIKSCPEEWPEGALHHPVPQRVTASAAP